MKHETGKVSSSEQSYQDERVTKAYIEVLRGLLGREPIHAEIIGKVDIPRAKKAKDRVTHE